MSHVCLPVVSMFGVLLVVALPAEARVLIDHCKLKRSTEKTPWPVYINKENTVILVQSGVGACAASACVGWVMGAMNLSAFWSVVNIGIAGSQDLEIGECVIAHTVLDDATGRKVYCYPPRRVIAKEVGVRTVAIVKQEYDVSYIDDMEAAGVLLAAKQFVPIEQCAVAKVVSDNSTESRNAISKSIVLDLMRSSLDALARLVDSFLEKSRYISSEMKQPSLPLVMLEQVHHSVSQKRKLEKVWRMLALYLNEEECLLLVAGIVDAKQLIAVLEKKLLVCAEYWSNDG